MDKVAIPTLVAAAPRVLVTAAGISKVGTSSSSTTLSPTVNSGEDSRILEQLASMKHRIDDMVSRESSLPTASSVSAGLDVTQYVCNTASHRWHVPRSGQLDMIPLLWAARCGLAYGQSAFELSSTLPMEARSEHICERCLPDEKAAARIHETVEVPASSCSSSTSNDTA
jgi:hypothetical protein